MLKNPPKNRKAHGCPTGKKRFRDHQDAVSFLHYAANARVAAAFDRVETTHRAARSYECVLCRGFHVTSQVRAA